MVLREEGMAPRGSLGVEEYRQSVREKMKQGSKGSGRGGEVGGGVKDLAAWSTRLGQGQVG